jgi:hypothetical protein
MKKEWQGLQVEVTTFEDLTEHISVSASSDYDGANEDGLALSHLYCH